MSELKRKTQMRIGVESGHPLVIDAGTAPDDVFSVLADEPRRQVLAVVCEASTPMAVSTLAARVADRLASERPEPVSDAAVDRLRVSLHHRHLPKMASAGLVEYDTENRTIEATDVIRS